MRRTVLLAEYDAKGMLSEARIPTKARSSRYWSAIATRTPSDPGADILVVAGSDGGFSGPCLAQHGCRSPQGMAPGEGFTKRGGTNCECIAGQHE
jgi:hypothetical protein